MAISRSGDAITRDLNDVNIATRDHLIPKAVVAINEANIISSRMLKKAKPWRGGELVKVILDYGETSPQEMESKYDPVVNQNIDDFEQIYLKRYWVDDNITMPWIDVHAGNSGKEKILKITTSKVKAMTRGMKKKMSQMLFRAAGSAGSNQMPSIYDWTQTTTSSTQIGGFSQDDIGGAYGSGGKFNWTPEVLDLSSDTVIYNDLINEESPYFIEALIRQQMSLIAEKSGEEVNLIVMNQYLWDAWDTYLSRKDVGRMSDKKYDGGRTYIAFRGARAYAEAYSLGGAQNPSSTSVISLLNEDYMGYHKFPEVDMKFTPWHLLENHKVYRAEMDWAGVYACTRRDVHGSIIVPVSEHE